MLASEFCSERRFSTATVPPVDVFIERRDGVAVLALTGDLDELGSEQLTQAAGEALADGDHNIVIDMSAVSVVDGSGLAALVDLFKRVRIGPGDVRLCGLQAWVKVVFAMTHLNRVFEQFPNRDEAVASYAKVATA